MSIIKGLREKLGYTQVLLSKKTGLSLRTIQRLEAHNKVPKGHTLIVLSEIFNMTPDVLSARFLPPKASGDEDILSVKLINTSVLIFVGVPFGNVLLPLILWRRNRDSIIVDEAGKRILNFQILWSAVLAFLLSITPFTGVGTIFSMSPLLVVLFVAMVANIGVVCHTAMRLQQNDLDFLNLPIRLV